MLLRIIERKCRVQRVLLTSIVVLFDGSAGHIEKRRVLPTIMRITKM